MTFQLIKLLTSHPVNEKEVHGVKVSTRILENLTPQEIRDLRVVFELFDTNDDGYVICHEEIFHSRIPTYLTQTRISSNKNWLYITKTCPCNIQRFFQKK